MKNLLVILALGLICGAGFAQSAVYFRGQLTANRPTEPLYLAYEESLVPLKISTDGTFFLEGFVQQKPSFFRLATVSKQGKILPQTPYLWFDQDTVDFLWNGALGSVALMSELSIQSESEKIEALPENERIAGVIQQPNSHPSLYFADLYKEKIPILSLESMVQQVKEPFQNSIYFKRIEAFLQAQKLTPFQKGKSIETILLPNRAGERVPVFQANGQKQVLAVFSSGCSWSVASIDLLHQLTQKYPQKLKVSSIWIDFSQHVWLNAYQKQKSKITWTDLWDEHGLAAAYFRITQTPTFYLLRDDGVVEDILYNYNQKTANKLKKWLE